jgi:hypothetical protein
VRGADKRWTSGRQSRDGGCRERWQNGSTADITRTRGVVEADCPRCNLNRLTYRLNPGCDVEQRISGPTCRQPVYNVTLPDGLVVLTTLEAEWIGISKTSIAA